MTLFISAKGDVVIVQQINVQFGNMSSTVPLASDPTPVQCRRSLSTDVNENWFRPL